MVMRSTTPTRSVSTSTTTTSSFRSQLLMDLLLLLRPLFLPPIKLMHQTSLPTPLEIFPPLSLPQTPFMSPPLLLILPLLQCPFWNQQRFFLQASDPPLKSKHFFGKINTNKETNQHQNQNFMINRSLWTLVNSSWTWFEELDLPFLYTHARRWLLPLVSSVHQGKLLISKSSPSHYCHYNLL